jgi:RNA polymerase sigma-70 factor (ECF subfamily)
MADAEEFDRQFARAADRLRLFIDLRLGAALRARLEPADVLQDAYVEGRRAFDARAPRDARGFAAWLCRITENRLRGLADHFGARKRRGPGAAVRLSAIAEAAVVHATGPVTGAARVEADQRLRAALSALHDDEREALLRRYFAEQTLDEIAAATGRSASAVRRLLARATARLGADLLGVRSPDDRPADRESRP